MLLLIRFVAPGEVVVSTEVSAILALISAIVIGLYVFILYRRSIRRKNFFSEIGFSAAGKVKRKRAVSQMKIKSKGSNSLSVGAGVYVSACPGGEIIICDLVASVGLGRYAGFSKVTLLGFYGKIGELCSFIIRKPYIMETRLELGDARPLGNGWCVWSSGFDQDYSDDLMRQIEEFGGSAVIRKNGSFMSLYYSNKYLNEGEVKKLLPIWKRFCDSFIKSEE